MNTTLKGDKFENLAIDLVHKLIEEEQLLINMKYIRPFKKQKYKSLTRDGYVEFDYVIEVWPPNAERYSVIYFIECKDYKNRVGIDKIKKFHNDIEEVSGANAKGILITRSLLQDGAKQYAEANGFMIVQANSVEDYKIIYHKTGIKDNSIPTLNGKIEDEGILGLTKIIDKQINKAFVEFKEGVSFNIDRMSKEKIEKLCTAELQEINPRILTDAENLDINSLKRFLKKKYDIIIQYHEDRNLLGYCDIANKTISLRQDVKDTKRELFILCHEFGHYKLHHKLIIDQFTYNNFTESEYNFKMGKHSLENPKHWIEWQANYFAVSMILPKTSVLAMLWQHQQRIGINTGKLYLDDQKENYQNYQTLLYRLSEYFNVTRPNILYRLKEIDHYENRSNLKNVREILEGMIMDQHI
ncbi:ImmA/IrrE family metallo-endopeptidase [Chryseobacterium shandongense]|uniref:ImmA/IrrE family metallo-endopeptidase n=1 Tax=Chryseobacterium shandongense TaxID=1493872 RepID=UPI000F4F7323|nr:ImmA/IrrE family metallo-endopeptidase [Chryseobacterium shandongense]AZA56323.1 ImmA/IrrE family metallo-endopeptidase [Chryseobacterium shandongense]